jgi:hypothetical protein
VFNPNKFQFSVTLSTVKVPGAFLVLKPFFTDYSMVGATVEMKPVGAKPIVGFIGWANPP